MPSITKETVLAALKKAIEILETEERRPFDTEAEYKHLFYGKFLLIDLDLYTAETVAIYSFDGIANKADPHLE